MQICRLVGGLPLGIRLAATLVRLLQRSNCDTSGAEHYTILTTTFHDLPIRHRSVEATLAIHWQLLSAVDRLTFAQCAIFPDSFTLAAIAARIWRHRPPDTASGRPNVTATGRPRRYTMHRLMREQLPRWQRTQLKMPTVEQHVRERHCLYFVAQEFSKKAG